MTAKAAVAAWLVWWSGASASEDPTAAFLAAARQGRAAEVKRLLAAAPELVGATTCERETALMLAAMGGHLKTMRVLLDAGAEIDAAGPDGKTAIALAAEQCQVGAARLLLGVGIKVWDHGTADLVLAARSGCASVIRELLRAGARPVWPEGDRHTPLEEAVEAGCVPCVSALLERTVPLARDERRKVVAWAAERGDVVLLQRLLALGELSDDGGVAERRALRAAVEASRVRTARQLLVAGADPSGEGGEGTTLLSAAVVRDDAAMVRLLLSQGLPVDGRDEYGVTALMYAAHRGRRRIVTALLRAGADPNLLTEDRRSALMLAAETGQEAIALALVRAGGDRRQEDRWGRTAADYAAARGYARLARVLGGRRPVVRSAFRAAPPIRPALLEKFPAPSRDPSKGCDESWCVAVGRTERVCVGRTGSDQEARIERRAQVIARWSSPGFDPRDFEVLMADLDGDGDRELIVARHCYTGNGLGIAYWTVAILDGSGGAPLLFTVHDYGVGTFEAIEDEIIVNVTQWARGSDPVRGDGTYFQATPFRYRAGVLVPALDRAARRRRLFHVSCPECRDASVRCWLSGPFAEAAACDPLPVGHPYGGSIVRLLATDDGVVAIDVVLDGGGECGLDLSGAATDLGERIETVVDGRSGREYPPDYHPADVARWLTGRRCTLLLDQDGGGRDVLWIW